MPDTAVLFSESRASFLASYGDVLDVGVLMVDPQLRVTAWNAWLERATGRTEAATLGKHLSEVDPTIRATVLAAFGRAIDGATVLLSHRLHGYVLDMPAPSGYESLPRMKQSARLLTLRDEAGAPRGAVALIQDVTERAVREDELRVAVEEAQAATRAKSEFLAAMSHELRTPIGAASGYASLLAEGLFGAVTPEQHETLGRIVSVSTHLLHIVDEILSFARIEAGREDVHVADADAVRIANEAIVAVEPLAIRKGLTLTHELPATPLPMQTDPVKVRQVLINLLGNAVKFTTTGGIVVRVVPENDVVAFEIADTGPGIAADDLTRIFEPFTQVSNTATRAREGTGLGLTLSRELTRLLGGDLTVRSQLGAGSTFRATIPAHAVSRSA